MTTGRTQASGPAGVTHASRPARRAQAGGLTGRTHLSWPRRAAPAPAGGRFGLLLLILIFTYLLSAFTSGAWVNAVQIVLFLAVAVLAMRSGRLGRRTIRVVIVVGIGGTMAAVTLAITHSADAGAGVANLWAALVLLGAVVIIVGRVLSQRTVTLQSIFGAVSAYMILGLMFAAIYNAMNKFDGGTFFANGATGTIKLFQYFSFTTLTTLGYGDYTAMDTSGQAVAVMEALLGQVFLATLVARLVAAFRAPAPARAGRTVPRPGGRGTPSLRRPARRWPSLSQRRRQAGVARGLATRASSHARAQPARRSRARPGR
jgi:ion channel